MQMLPCSELVSTAKTRMPAIIQSFSGLCAEFPLQVCSLLLGEGKKEQVSLLLRNRPLPTTCRLPGPGEGQNLMPPETFEFIEILLDIARPAPSPRFLHEVKD